MSASLDAKLKAAGGASSKKGQALVKAAAIAYAAKVKGSLNK